VIDDDSTTRALRPATPAPAIRDDWALFLDLDGTLIDIAPAPDAVVVAPGLREALAALHRRLSGALAIVSGRSLRDIDALVPLGLAAGAEHGAVLRGPDGQLVVAADMPTVPPRWLAALHEFAGLRPGVLVEEKSHAVALHWRLAQEHAEAAEKLLASLTAEDPRYEVLPARMAAEIRARGATKARPVTLLMRQHPFQGRIPVFVGDDVTDEDGMEAAAALGGFGLRVPEAFGGSPEEVRAWIARGAAAAAPQ